jgi:hypothetical protein
MKHDVSVLGKPRTGFYMSGYISVDGGYTTNSTTDVISITTKSPNSTEEHFLTVFTTFKNEY